MAAPLLRGERALGVLTVLDRGQTGRGTLQEVDVLVTFAAQAAIAVDLTAAATRAGQLSQDGENDLLRVARSRGALGPGGRLAPDGGRGLLAALDILLAD